MTLQTFISKYRSRKTLGLLHRGQATLEIVLLMAATLVIWNASLRTLRERGVFQELFGGTWTRLSNIIEFGIPASETRSASSRHPASFYRHSTRLPEDAN